MYCLLAVAFGRLGWISQYGENTWITSVAVICSVLDFEPLLNHPDTD